METRSCLATSRGSSRGCCNNGHLDARVPCNQECFDIRSVENKQDCPCSPRPSHKPPHRVRGVAKRTLSTWGPQSENQCQSMMLRDFGWELTLFDWTSLIRRDSLWAIRTDSPPTDPCSNYFQARQAPNNPAPAQSLTIFGSTPSCPGSPSHDYRPLRNDQGDTRWTGNRYCRATSRNPNSVPRSNDIL